jgi:hydrogenase nickel incorporation protein HypA/HybF
MHEVSIAGGLLSAAEKECRRQGYSSIQQITVRIGKASGVMPEALLFAFEAMKQETIAHEALLTIVEVPVSGHCAACNADFVAEGTFVLCCPHCNGTSFRVQSGRELEIAEMEVS